MNAVMKKCAVLMLIVLSVASLMGCGGSKWQDGAYSASSEGRNGDVKVTVTIADGKMTSVVVDEHNETETVGGVAISTMSLAMVDEQTYDVDGVSGATLTSEALRNAVMDCLEQARG